MDNTTKETLYKELVDIFNSLEMRNYKGAMENLDTLIYKVEYNQL
tara:strand:- start:892 stop:1026 length:135 start_codon:yes stop_codon:yes gene_type:complete